MKALQCVDARVQERVLDGARMGQASSPEDLAHLDACDSCRAAVEMTRRVARTWRTLEPTRAELARARAKFVARRTGRAHPSRLLRGALILAVILVAAVASAAARVVVIRLRAPAPEAAGAISAAVENRPSRKGHGTGAVVHHADTPWVPVPLPEPATPAEPLVVSPDAVLPGVEPTAPVRALKPRLASTPAPAPSHDPTPEVSATNAWVTAAAAIRSGDYSQAEDAFAELARSPDAHTRDAARLARAQIWVSRGRIEEARPELDDLATNGATAPLRERAAAALASVH